MNMAQQILHWPPQSSYSSEDFIVSDSNRTAWEWVMRWPDWNGSGRLLLVGEPSSGKTHLTHIWCARAGATYVDASQLTETDIPAVVQANRHIAVDGLESLNHEATLFHLINTCSERQRSLLLTTAKPLQELSLRLPDLTSRISASLHAQLGLPDDVLLATLTVKLFSDRQVDVSAEVVDYIVRRTERSFSALRRCVSLIDNESLRTKKRITPALVKSLIF